MMMNGRHDDDELFVAPDERAAVGPALIEKLGVFVVSDAISPATGQRQTR
jgi:hypothetical protein